MNVDVQSRRFLIPAALADHAQRRLHDVLIRRGDVSDASWYAWATQRAVAAAMTCTTSCRSTYRMRSWRPWWTSVLTATTLSIAARTDWAAWWHAVVAQPALRDLERAQKAAPAAPGLSGPIVSVQLAFGHFAPTLSIVLIRHACTTPSRQPASPPG